MGLIVDGWVDIETDRICLNTDRIVVVIVETYGEVNFVPKINIIPIGRVCLENGGTTVHLSGDDFEGNGSRTDDILKASRGVGSTEIENSAGILARNRDTKLTVRICRTGVGPSDVRNTSPDRFSNIPCMDGNLDSDNGIGCLIQQCRRNEGFSGQRSSTFFSNGRIIRIVCLNVLLVNCDAYVVGRTWKDLRRRGGRRHGSNR